MRVKVEGCHMGVTPQESTELFLKVGPGEETSFPDNNLAARDKNDVILNLAASSQRAIQVEVISHRVPED